jgi:cold shock protein
MAVGTVKWFNTSKGYGFIKPDGGGADVFVHVTAVQRAGMQSLAEGQRISYEVTRDRGKLAASNLTSAE